MRGTGGAWRRPGHPDEEGRGQAGREAGGVAPMRAGGERVPLSSWREERDDWQRQSAGPACWAAGLHREVSAGKRFSTYFLFCFCFLFSDICFDLIKILNHFIFLCQFL